MATRSARGFTLVELLVSVAVAAVVMAGITQAVNAQQRAYYQGHRQRAVQGAGRAAIQAIEQRAQLAGFGMDAPLALDLDRYTTGPCPAELSPCPRDSITDSDELVFYARNPNYWTPADYGTDPQGKAWRITTGIAAGSVTVQARPGDVFLANQIVQAVCSSSADYVYFTVAQRTELPITASPGPLAIPLVAASAGDPFRRQDAATGACFGTGQARLFLIDRYRFHVRPVAGGSSARYDPYLVLDMGVDTNNDGVIDANDEIIIAEGIELLQVAYVMTSPALAPRGLTPGTAIAFTPGWPGATSGDGMTTLAFPGVVQAGQSVYAPTSFYGYPVGPPASPTRLTDHQANVRALRVAVVARSADPDPDQKGGLALQPLFNMNGLPAWTETDARYNRVNFQTTIPLRDMTVRGMIDF